jgi:hypothetical protein
MAATYRALHARAQRAHATSAKWRNRVTGFVILAVLIAAAVWGGGGALAGIRPVQRLRRVGTTPDGRPIYSE